MGDLLGDDIGDFLYPYNERLEAECVLRTRSILDEFVCSETGLTIQNSPRHLIAGAKRLWSLAMEMKRMGSEINERLVLLPLTFMLVLLKILAEELAAEDAGKMEVDPGMAEALLQLFYEIHDRLPVFKKRRDTRIVSRSLFLFVRHLIKEVGAGEHIKAFSHAPIKIENGRMKSPFRPNDMNLAMLTMRYFRDNVLKKYNRGPVKFSFTIAREVLDIMEPTRQKQLEVSGVLNTISMVVFVFAMVSLILVLLMKGMTAVQNMPVPEPKPKPGPQQPIGPIKPPKEPVSAMPAKPAQKTTVDASTQYDEKDLKNKKFKTLAPKNKWVEMADHTKDK